MPRSYTPTREQRAELESPVNNLITFTGGRQRPPFFYAPVIFAYLPV